MANDVRCLACHRTIVDEKVPLCSRCEKQGFKVVKDGGKLLLRLVPVALSLGAILSGQDTHDDTSRDV